MSDTVLIHLTLPPRSRAVSDARAAIEPLRERLSPEGFEDLRLMVSEVVTNSLRHVQLSPTDGIDLSARTRGSTLRVEVRDPGHGFAPPAPVPRATGGWGLVIVSALAAAWGVVDDGTTCVWFELPLARPGAVRS
jgi:two-component sensor histidine kinase